MGGGCDDCLVGGRSGVSGTIRRVFDPLGLASPQGGRVNDHFYNPIAMSNCTYNVMKGLEGRVFLYPPPLSPSKLKGMRFGLNHAIRFSRGLRVEPYDKERFLSCYSGSKRGRYAAMLEKLEYCENWKKYSNIQVFVKTELRDGLSDPRIIQARHPFYNWFLGRWLKPYEHQIYQMKEPREVCPNPMRVIAKGLNMTERAALMYRKWTTYEQPVALSFDIRRFDAHVRREHLLMVHKLYKTFLPNREHAALKAQLHNLAYFEGKLVYEGFHGRCSGDVDTALGNCLISFMAVVGCMRELRIKCSTIIDGDDFIVFCDLRDFKGLRGRIEEIMFGYGFNLTVDVAHEFEQVEFCRSRPVNLGTHWQLVRTPDRVLSHFGTSTRNFSLAQDNSSMLSTMALCELSLNSGVPVLQELALACNPEQGDARHLPELDYYRIMADGIGRGKASDILDVTRSSFHRAFGIDPSEQMLLESVIRARSVNKLVSRSNN